MNKILIAGFEGANNSAKILLDKISLLHNIEKLYLVNDFEKCALQITKRLQQDKFDLIIAFGQKPLIKAIYLETQGLFCGQKYETVFPVYHLKYFLSNKGFKVKISKNAGNYLCNHVYGVGLSYIEQKRLAIPYIFIHIPISKNISDFEKLACVFNEYNVILSGLYKRTMDTVVDFSL